MVTDFGGKTGTGIVVGRKSLWRDAAGDMRLMDESGGEFGAKVISGEGGCGWA